MRTSDRMVTPGRSSATRPNRIPIMPRKVMTHQFSWSILCMLREVRSLRSSGSGVIFAEVAMGSSCRGLLAKTPTGRHQFPSKCGASPLSLYPMCRLIACSALAFFLQGFRHDPLQLFAPVRLHDDIILQTRLFHVDHCALGVA